MKQENTETRKYRSGRRAPAGYHHQASVSKSQEVARAEKVQVARPLRQNIVDRSKR